MGNMPASFGKYKSNVKPPKFKRLLIATQGMDNTGKTEFLLSAPGPGIIVSPDRGGEGCLENQTPPETRQDNMLLIPYKVLQNKGANLTAKPNAYAEDWIAFREFVYDTLDNEDSITESIDGGSFVYELIRLAVHGRVEKVPSMAYSESDAVYKNFLSKLCDSGKNIIMTHIMKPEYVDKLDPFGKPVLKDGVPEKVKSGEYTRQGHRDHEFLFWLQLEHLFRPKRTVIAKVGVNKGKSVEKPMEWGIRILRCKFARQFEGEELWGSDCNFQSLVTLLYPDVDLEQWGYK